MPIELLIPIGIVAVLLVGGLFLADTIERARRRRYEQAAADLRFAFHDKDQSALPSGASRFHLMRLGQVRVAERIMRGEANGIGVTMFEISNTSGLGFMVNVKAQTVVAFDSGQLSLPPFFLRPAAVIGGLPAPPGLRDFDLNGHPGLSGKFALAGEPDQEDRVLAMFDPELLHYLEASPGLCAEGWGNLLMVYYPGRAVPLAEYPAFMQEAFRLFALFKRKS